MLKLLETNSFLNKISVQESSRGKFICPKCSTFSTNLKSEFESHLRDNHPDYDQVKCIFCDVNFDFSAISTHIETHFEENLRSRNICNLCNVSVKMDSEKSILQHLIDHHNNEFVCPLCKTDYRQESQLSEHINANLTTIYHCSVDNCWMKTSDIDELNFHRTVSDHHTESCFEEHTFNCRIKLEENVLEPVLWNLPEKVDKNRSKIDKNRSIIDKTRPEQFQVVWQLIYRKDLSGLVLGNRNQSELFAEIEKKLSVIDSYRVGIAVGLVQKLYCCMACEFAPQMSHWVVKRHILLVHCRLNKKQAGKAIRFIEFKRDKVSISTSGVNNHRRKSLSVSMESTKGTRKPKFQKVFQIRCDWVKFDEINPTVAREKLERIERFSVGLVIHNRRKEFHCSDCGKRWTHSHWNLRKHILMSHCDFEEEELRPVIGLVTLVGNDNQSISSDDESPINLNQSRSNYQLQLKCRWDMFRKVFRNLDQSSCALLRQKMAPVDSFSVEVRFIKDKRSFRCLLCSYKSNYSSWDVRRHLLVSHCGISQPDSYRGIKLIDLIRVDNNNNNNDNNESQNRYPTRNTDIDSSPIIDNNPESIVDIDRIETPFLSVNGSIYRLTYSRPKLRAMFRRADRETRDDMERKMGIYERCVVQRMPGGKTGWCYLCALCGYKSQHHISDVRKHILGRHCGIPQLALRDCLRVSLAELDRDSSSNNQSDSEQKLDKSMIDNDDRNPKRNKMRESSEKPIETRKRKPTNPDKVEEPTIKKSRLSLSIEDAPPADLPSLPPPAEPRKIVIDREIDLNYSPKILDKLFELENAKLELRDTRDKLDSIYRRTKVRIGRKFQSELFICSSCHWFSGKSIDNVTGHIIETHLGIDQSLVPLVVKATRMNSSHRLMSDREISAEGWNGEPILTQFRSI